MTVTKLKKRKMVLFWKICICTWILFAEVTTFNGLQRRFPNLLQRRKRSVEEYFVAKHVTAVLANENITYQSLNALLHKDIEENFYRKRHTFLIARAENIQNLEFSKTRLVLKINQVVLLKIREGKCEADLKPRKTIQKTCPNGKKIVPITGYYTCRLNMDELIDLNVKPILANFRLHIPGDKMCRYSEKGYVDLGVARLKTKSNNEDLKFHINHLSTSENHDPQKC